MPQAQNLQSSLQENNTIFALFADFSTFFQDFSNAMEFADFLSMYFSSNMSQQNAEILCSAENAKK